ncbi:MAG: hypothetical protein ACRBG0_02770 [Lewinella sp.]|uniref:hypothetical protein n=1 Tax=Lewinella sp. TaxID=2004506 RepID=UPI003D6A832D
MRKSSWYLLLLLLVVLEVISQTYLAAFGNKDLAAIAYLLAGIGIGLLPLLKREVGEPSPPKQEQRSNRWTATAFGLVIAGIGYFGIQAIKAQPLDYTFADMLPIIQIMGERWLAGEEVYAVISEIWDGMQPIYLPVMWLSYLPAILADVDIRIINLFFIALASGAALQFGRQQYSVRQWWVYVPLLILLSYILVTYTTFITISEEPIVVGFYALLGYSVYRQRAGWIVLALAGCLLSRYALIFWAGTYFIYMLWQEDHRKALWIMGGTAVMCLFLMIVSQGIYEIDLFYSLKDAYLDSFQNPDVRWRTENTIAKNIGLARFVDFDHLLVLHRAVFLGSLLLPPLLYIWYHFRLRHRVASSLFALCSLKLCLVYFFNMNALPYSYLFYTSTFLSLVVLGVLTRKEGASNAEGTE